MQSSVRKGAMDVLLKYCMETKREDWAGGQSKAIEDVTLKPYP